MIIKSEINVTPDEVEYLIRMLIDILEKRNHINLD